MLEKAYYLINHHTAFLYTVIYKSHFFFIDYWSFVHLVNGIWIMLFSCHKRWRHPFIVLGLVLFSWEFLEISFIYLSIQTFKPETIPDQFADIIIGYTGGLLGWLLWQYRDKALMKLCRKRSPLQVEFFVSCAMSLFWVGSYGYTYNVSFFNSPGLNWLAFLLWSSGLFATIRIYRLFSHRVRPFWMRIVLSWLAYFSILLLIEYLGYYVFEIRQVTSEGPLLFGLIHGTVPLKIYYIIAGICAVVASSGLERAFRSFTPEKAQFTESGLLEGHESYDRGKRLNESL